LTREQTPKNRIHFKIASAGAGKVATVAELFRFVNSIYSLPKRHSFRHCVVFAMYFILTSRTE
jgi:hypothetical protein